MSRRAAIKAGLLGGAAFSALPRFDVPSVKKVNPPDSYNELFGNPSALGRAETWDWYLRSVRADPEDENSHVRYVERKEIVPIYKAIHAPAPYYRLDHNPLWFDVGDGYLHASHIVPSREIFNEPVADVGEGFWAEITVPVAPAMGGPGVGGAPYFTFYYGSVFWVVERRDDWEGKAWYRVLDDGLLVKWWIEARYMKRITPEEIAPISPEVSADRKRIEISVPEQTLTCLEDDMVVFASRISTGTPYINRDGKQFGYRTPGGNHHVLHKRPSRRMTGGDPESVTNSYDLPGVPWCIYFTQYGGMAIHGTYWHNNYGTPGSHGCVNVTSDAAKWIYRWVNPTQDYYEETKYTTDPAPNATLVHVIEDEA